MFRKSLLYWFNHTSESLIPRQTMDSSTLSLIIFLGTFSTQSYGQFFGGLHHGLVGGIAHHHHTGFLGAGHLFPHGIPGGGFNGGGFNGGGFNGGGFLGGVGHHHHHGFFRSANENELERDAEETSFSSSAPRLGRIDLPGFDNGLWLIYPSQSIPGQRAANLDVNAKSSQSTYPTSPRLLNPDETNKGLSFSTIQRRNLLPKLLQGSAALSLFTDQGSGSRKDLVSYGLHKYGVQETDYGFGNKPSSTYVGGVSLNPPSLNCRCPSTSSAYAVYPPKPTSTSPLNNLRPYHNAHISQGYAVNDYGITGTGTNAMDRQYGIRGKLGLL